MKYLKLQDRWKVIETGAEFLFGKLIIDYYEFLYEKYNKWSNEFQDMYDQGISFKEIDKKAENYWGSKELEKEVEFFLEVIDDYLGDDNAEIHLKTFHPREVKNKWNKSIDEQNKLHNERIQRIKENGWIDVEHDYHINLIDLYLLRRCAMDKITLSVTHHLYKSRWYPAYSVNNSTEEVALALIDLQELRNQNLNFKRCKHCYKIFIQKDGRNKYCEECSEKYKKIADQKRKETPRGKHKIVCNYLRNTGCFTDIEIGDFMRESNYYWDNLQSKSVEREKTFISNISSEEEYVCWLEKSHNGFKAEAKQRKYT